MRTQLLVASLSLLLTTVAPPLSWAGQPAKEAPLDINYLRKHAETRGFMLGRPVRARPTPDGKSVLFLRAAPPDSKLSLYEFEVSTRRTHELLSPATVLKGGEEKLTPEEKARRERMRVPSGGFTDFQFDEAGKQVLLSLSGRLYIYDRPAAKVHSATGNGVIDPKFRRDGGAVAYVRDNDVYVFDLAADKEKQVTTGGTKKVTHGLAEFVAQEEMGRFSGYWWSPDGKQIAYEEADADGVDNMVRRRIRFIRRQAPNSFIIHGPVRRTSRFVSASFPRRAATRSGSSGTERPTNTWPAFVGTSRDR